MIIYLSEEMIKLYVRYGTVKRIDKQLVSNEGDVIKCEKREK